MDDAAHVKFMLNHATVSSLPGLLNVGIYVMVG